MKKSFKRGKITQNKRSECKKYENKTQIVKALKGTDQNNIIINVIT